MYDFNNQLYILSYWLSEMCVGYTPQSLTAGTSKWWFQIGGISFSDMADFQLNHVKLQGFFSSKDRVFIPFASLTMVPWTTELFTAQNSVQVTSFLSSSSKQETEDPMGPKKKKTGPKKRSGFSKSLGVFSCRKNKKRRKSKRRTWTTI